MVPQHKRPHYPALDGLRGLGFLIVLVAHVGQAYRSYFIAGKVGVGLFFVLSAFLLTTQFLHKLPTVKDFRYWSSYIAKRVLRLYPMYIVILIAEVLFGKYSPSMVLSHLMLLDGRQHYWTVPVEFQFYALMPFIAYGLVYILKKDVWKSVGALAFSLVIYGLFFEIITAGFVRPLASQLSVLFYGPAFIMGVVLAAIYDKGFKVPKNTTKLLMYLSLIVTLVSFSYSYKMFTTAKFGVGLFWIFTLYGLAWAIITYALLTVKTAFSWMLEHPWMRFIGSVSYSAYLIHILVIRFAMSVFPESTMLGFICTFVVTLSLSAATYALIEKPAMGLKRYLLY